MNWITSIHGISDRQLSVIRFALHRFMTDAHNRATAAGQDKAERYFKPGAVEAFLRDAKDAEGLLALLPAEPMKDSPANQADEPK